MKKEISSIKGIIIIALLGLFLAGGLFVFGKNIKESVFFIKDFREQKEVEREGTKEDMLSVVRANNDFAFDLYSEIIKKEESNIFYSPYSVFSALAVVYEGARGETESEMKEVLNVLEKEMTALGFSRLYNLINSKGEISTGNAFWAQENYHFLEEYIDLVEGSYRAKISNLDFVNNTENARLTINDYIEKQTKERIKDLIPEGALNPLTRAVITNAIYFKGDWKYQFDKEKTREMDFYVTPENPVKKEMMVMRPEEARFNYLENDEVQAIELPYEGEEIVMNVIIPKDIDNFDLEKMKDYKEEMTMTSVDRIYIPKFEFNTKYSMKEVLSLMGMTSAFSENIADFSGMDGSRELFISDVIHQAFVKVDEEGTEAAAATGVVMEIISLPVEEIVFNANRPFIFTILEKETGSILFVGKVVNPIQDN